MSGQIHGPAISVILPVYNVGEYLEQCMESLAKQTCSDFEALLINDGSTDDSLARCEAWARRDARVRVVDKANEGVAATRNLGVRLARGEYIAFVDPDDWVEETYLEKLLGAARESGADFVECDLWRYDNRTGKAIYRACYGRMGVPYTLREHMKYGPTATYKSLSRRSLWTKNGVRMPSCSFESPAVYSLVLALAGGAVSVREPLYWYRRFRENSLIENGYADKSGRPDDALGVEAMRFLIAEFRRTGLYDRYAATLEGVVKYRLSDILAMQFHRRAPEEFQRLVDNYRAFLAEQFPGTHLEPYLTWGGYNLNRVLSHMNWLHDPACRCNFQSLASAVSGPLPRWEIVHRNRYRQIMLRRERDRAVWEIAARVRPKYFFLDLIEERFDLARFGEGIMTLSDAWQGSNLADAAPDETLPFGSPACEELWRESAARFFERLYAAAPGVRVVVVENYLSETVGTPGNTRPFPEAEAIRRANEILRGRYERLRAVLPDALFIPAWREENYFTDEKYEYGAVPSHLNEIVNEAVARRIESALHAKWEEAE